MRMDQQRARRHCGGRLFVTAIFLLLPSQLAAQTHALPFYSLPEPMKAAALHWTLTRGSGPGVEGTLTFTMLAPVEVDGEQVQRVDVLRQTIANTEARTVRVNLSDEAAGRSWLKRDDFVNVATVTPAGDLEAMPELAQRRFLDLGLGADETTLTIADGEQTVTTPRGEFHCRKATAISTRGDRTLTYHVWLSENVPFGIVRFEIHEARGQAPSRKIFEAEIM